MAGTTDNYLVTRWGIGPARAYANLGGTANAPWDLADGVRLLLHTDGSPNATQNPNAVHLGGTEGGEEWSVKSTKTDFFDDEHMDPQTSRVTQEEAVLSGSLRQVSDMAVQAIMNPTATRSDVGGSEGLTWGKSSPVIVFRSFAVIWPVEGSTTLFNVFHIYKGYNDQGMAVQISSKKAAASPFAIRAYGIPTRAENDQLARFFRQVSGAS
jgi:hypothetical protein